MVKRMHTFRVERSTAHVRAIAVLAAVALGLTGGLFAASGMPMQDGPRFEFKKGGGPFKKDGLPGFGLKKNSGPKIGDRAPDFELKFLDAKETFKLSDNFGKRPTVLIFHSFTWSPARGLLGQFEQLFEANKKTIDFKIVYIRDTHPVLGFRAPTNDRLGIAAALEPKNLADREKWACEDRKKLKCTIPVIMDTFDDKTLTAYNAFPQRLLVLDKGGKIVYASSGLVGFDLEGVAKAVKSVDK